MTLILEVQCQSYYTMCTRIHERIHLQLHILGYYFCYYYYCYYYYYHDSNYYYYYDYIYIITTITISNLYKYEHPRMCGYITRG